MGLEPSAKIRLRITIRQSSALAEEAKGASFSSLVQSSRIFNTKLQALSILTCYELIFR